MEQETFKLEDRDQTLHRPNANGDVLVIGELTFSSHIEKMQNLQRWKQVKR